MYVHRIENEIMASAALVVQCVLYAQLKGMLGLKTELFMPVLTTGRRSSICFSFVETQTLRQRFSRLVCPCPCPCGIMEGQLENAE